MLSATIGVMALLAASLLSQDPVDMDPDYDPKPGDRAVLANRLGRPECYLTLEDLKLSALAYIDQDPISQPDTCCPKHGTAVKVLDAPDFVYESRRGQKIKMRALRIQVLDGGFKGKTLYVRRANVVRFLEPKPLP
jgi:hypothetical protein